MIKVFTTSILRRDNLLSCCWRWFTSSSTARHTKGQKSLFKRTPAEQSLRHRKNELTLFAVTRYEKTMSGMENNGSSATEVVIHPLVLLSVADHYNREAKDTRKRVVGVLLGSRTKNRVDITNSFAVPFEEDLSNPTVWFLDHNFLESMFWMFKKVNSKLILHRFLHRFPSHCLWVPCSCAQPTKRWWDFIAVVRRLRRTTSR